MTNKKIEIVALSSIIPDAEQPRKDFDAARLSELMRSIKTHGIMNPLVIEERPNGKYMLVDGERRYRASQELGLKEVPAIVVKEQSPTVRLIQQFHLQEQHQGWSALEKAMAVVKLSEDIHSSIRGIAETLSIPERTINDYVAFSRLVDPSSFVKSEVSISFAKAIAGLTSFVRLTWQREDMEFTRDMQKKLEGAVLTRIKKGEITNPSSLTRVKDSVRSDPKSILKFLSTDTMSLDKLFLESKARKAYFYRNIIANSRYLNDNISKGLKLGSEEYLADDKGAITTLRTAEANIKRLLAKVD